MSGHSKWATIKRKKALTDERRGKLFAKLLKDIEVAARLDPDPLKNPSLGDAIQRARKSSVPNENIVRALKRGEGLEGPDGEREAVLYEGYGEGGAAFVIECTTDNRNRAAGEIRSILTRRGGSLARTGEVQYLFVRRGSLVVDRPKNGASVTTEALIDILINNGAEEIDENETAFHVVCSVESVGALQQKLADVEVHVESNGIAYIPSNPIGLAPSALDRVSDTISALENCSDVSRVYTNVSWGRSR